MLTIDGSMGEGGGQVLRSALALALCLGRPFRIAGIRTRRDRPGLQRQHLAAVEAAARISHARVTGAELASQQLSFMPGPVAAGTYHFDIGTAGSTTLVLQTILPALMLAQAPSQIRLVGGTHNPQAPSYEFLAHAFLPLVNRMGPAISATLVRPGFYPAGGGILDIAVRPAPRLDALEILQRGAVTRQHACAMVSRLPRHIAERELRVLAREFGLAPAAMAVAEVEAYGPGNAVTMELQCEHITEVFSGIGQRGLPAEQVAQHVAGEAKHYLAADVPVGARLADQLLLPFALAGSGSFVTLAPSLHTTTNIQVIESFTGASVECVKHGEMRYQISFGETRRD